MAVLVPPVVPGPLDAVDFVGYLGIGDQTKRRRWDWRFRGEGEHQSAGGVNPVQQIEDAGRGGVQVLTHGLADVGIVGQ